MCGRALALSIISHECYFVYSHHRPSCRFSGQFDLGFMLSLPGSTMQGLNLFAHFLGGLALAFQRIGEGASLEEF